MVLVVTPLRLLPEVIAERAPSHLITLLSPEELIETPAGFDPKRHLRLGVHDIAVPEAGMIAPTRGWWSASWPSPRTGMSRRRC